MKKLTTMFAMLAMTTALGLSACKKDPETKQVDPVAKPTEETKPTEAKPDDKKPEEPKPAGALPAECDEYKAAIESLSTCEKLPQATRDALKQSYEQTSAAWASVPAEGRAALGTSCKAATDAVKQSAAACK